MFALVALDALDDDLGGRALLALARLGRFGIGGFLLGVFFRALLRVDAQAREVLREGFAGVEGVVEGGVGFGEPFGAFFGGAAEFTVLFLGEGGLAGGLLRDSRGGTAAAAAAAALLGSLWFGLAARSRTYFWREGTDTAVDYGLGRTGV